VGRKDAHRMFGSAFSMKPSAIQPGQRLAMLILPGNGGGRRTA
jgi:hypothetical protein